MKKPIAFGIMLILIFALFTGVAGASTMVITESQLTTDPATQSQPDIDGIHVVYQDNRNGNWDIYLFTLQGTFTPETRLTNDTHDQMAPKINGNRIVYQDNRNSDVETGRHWDIYLYDLVDKTETRITNNSATQQNPAMYGNQIVWEDNRNGHWDIYLYDLVSRNETRLTFSGINNRHPAIYGDRVVYEKETKDSLGYPVHTIYRIDLPGTQEIFVSQLRWGYMDPNVLFLSVMYANRVVYENEDVYWDEAFGWWNNDGNIHMKDLSTGGEWKTSNLAYQMHPDISDYYIVYQDDRNRNWDIYLFHLDRLTETQVTNNTATQCNPAISGGYLVYQDDRNGNTDIYVSIIGYVIDTPVPTPPVPSPGPGSTSYSGSLYVASRPSGATILINGTDYGTTNKNVANVPAGNQTLTLTKEGYLPYSTVVDVQAGSMKFLDPIILIKSGEGGVPLEGTGTLYVASRPSGATILINGTDYGMTNKNVANVPAGNQNLTLTKEGYQPYSTVVDVQAGSRKLFPPITLVKAPAPTPGNITAFIGALEQEGFTVQQGKFERFDVIAMYDAGIIPGCFGNNPSTPYLVYKLPPYPGLVTGGLITDAKIYPENAGLWLDSFMEPDEAVVFVGKTPPEVKYFSYRSYLSSRFVVEEHTFTHIFASLGDQLNNVRIRTNGNTSSGPYGKPVMIISTADRGTHDRVLKAAVAAGYPPEMVNDDIIPSGLIRMGTENTSDTLTFIHRVALFANETIGQEYVNSPPGTVLRLTPNVSGTRQPYSVPPLIVRGTGDTRELDLLPDQEALREAIIARIGAGMVTTEQKTGIYIFEGYDSIQREANAQGDNRDTVYLSCGNYTLSDGESIVIFGVNHQKTGKAIYTNAAVYGADILNGVAVVTNAEYNGTADSYLPGNQNAGLLYVWKFARHCNGEAGCTEIPSCCGAAGIPEGSPLMIGFRAYVEPETGVGPSWTEVLYDQAIHFTPA